MNEIVSNERWNLTPAEFQGLAEVPPQRKAKGSRLHS